MSSAEREVGYGAAGSAALDVLLTDAAVGNPASRMLREPGSALAAAARVGRPDQVARRGLGLTRESARAGRR